MTNFVSKDQLQILIIFRSVFVSYIQEIFDISLPDINECFQNPYICGSQECINTEGGHLCRKKCSRGFIRDENGVCKGMNTVIRKICPFSVLLFTLLFECASHSG